MSSRRVPDGATSRAVAAAAPAIPVVGGVVAGGWASGSRMSAPSPRPSAFRGIGNHLPGKLKISFCAFTVYVVQNNRFTEARGFGEPDISEDHGLKDLLAEEAAEVG